jgi:hypothetical protein
MTDNKMFSGGKPEEKTAKEKAKEILSSSTSGSLFYIPYPGRMEAYLKTNASTATEEEIKGNMQENPLISQLSSQDLIEACLETKNIYTLFDCLNLIEKRGPVDKDKIVEEALKVDSTYTEYIISNLTSGKLGKLKDSTLDLLGKALGGKYKYKIDEYKSNLK